MANHYHVYHAIGIAHQIVYDTKVKTKKEAMKLLTKAKKDYQKSDPNSTFEGRIIYGYVESKQEYIIFYAQHHNNKCEQLDISACYKEHGITTMGFTD